MSALAGLRVLELTQVMAGPFCGQVLGDMGADVVKIEPLSGDSTREALGAAAFLAVNRNKRSVALDLKSLSHQAVLHRLVTTRTTDGSGRGDLAALLFHANKVASSRVPSRALKISPLSGSG